MKGIDHDKEKVEVHEEVDQQKELKYLFSKHIPKGCFLYYLDLETMEFGRVDDKAEHKLDVKRGSVSSKRKHIQRPNAIYEVASNARNAARKINNELERVNAPFRINIKKERRG